MSSILFALCLWQATAAAVKINLNTVCATGCQTTVSNIGFSGISALEDYYGSLCGNVLQVKSTFNCMREYCSESGLLKGWNGLNEACELDGGVELLPWSIIDNVTEAEVKSWPILTYEDTQLGAEFNTSVSVDQDLFQFGYQTIVSGMIFTQMPLHLINTDRYLVRLGGSKSEATQIRVNNRNSLIYFSTLSVTFAKSQLCDSRFLGNHRPLRYHS